MELFEGLFSTYILGGIESAKDILKKNSFALTKYQLVPYRCVKVLSTRMIIFKKKSYFRTNRYQAICRKLPLGCAIAFY